MAGGSRISSGVKSDSDCLVGVVIDPVVNAISLGDSWIGKGRNILLFGPPGVGKSHLGSAIGPTLIEKGHCVQFTRATNLVQKLQQARRDLVIESAIAKQDKLHLLILDDIT